MSPGRRRTVPDEPLADRVARLERVLGRLLIFFAAAEIIGEEDVAAIEKELHRKAILTVRKESKREPPVSGMSETAPAA